MAVAGLSGHDAAGRTVTLKNPTALHFLIAWSLFESKCFDGFMKLQAIDDFADRLANKESFDVECISVAAAHFHSRYQDQALYDHLIHKKNSPRMVNLLKANLGVLSPSDKVFAVAFTVYRFRNNIFHGNKGVDSWLQFGTQIELCTRAMQVFVSHRESVAPTMKLPQVA